MCSELPARWCSELLARWRSDRTGHVTLVAGGRETSYRVQAMASRLAHLLVIDTLFTGLILIDPRLAGPA
jgi:DNA-binding MurR/RpiR family transcriptional regulator